MNGVRYLDKARFLLDCRWSLRHFGVSEFSARLPLTLFALASLFAVILAGARRGRKTRGLFSALVLARRLGRIFTHDSTFPTSWWSFGSLSPFVCSGRAWISQPVQAAVLDYRNRHGVQRADEESHRIGVSGCHHRRISIVDGQPAHLLRLRLISTTAVFLAVAAPWHVLATLQNPPQGEESKGFFWFYFINGTDLPLSEFARAARLR